MSDFTTLTAQLAAVTAKISVVADPLEKARLQKLQSLISADLANTPVDPPSDHSAEIAMLNTQLARHSQFSKTRTPQAKAKQLELIQTQLASLQPPVIVAPAVTDPVGT